VERSVPLNDGDTIGPYQVIGQLGQGGMATVYKAYHPNLDRHVAIKMMHQGFLDDPTFLARFKREAQIVARLEHPHIVPVYDYSEHEGRPYLVMKFIEGSTLKDDSSRNALPMTQILHIMNAVGSALSYAHEHGVLHRDVKPSNIVIDTRNTPYVTDFGLARMAQAGESTMSQDMILGTPHYISPEQAKGNQPLDARADIYSLGVVLYKLVVGQVPFSGDTPYAIIHDHIYTPLPLPSVINPDVPPQVEQVLVKALAKEPASRYNSAVEMVDAFRAAIQAEPGIAKPRNVATPKKRQSGTALSQKTPRLVSVPAPTALPTVIERTPTLQRPPTKRNVWVLGGVGILLLTCLVSTMILMNMVGKIAQLQALVPEATGESLTEIPQYDIPRLTIEEAQAAIDQQSDNPILYLALAQAFWEEDMPQQGLAAINNGLEHADDQAVYLINAARLSQESGQSERASELFVRALNLAQENAVYYAAVRAEAGQFLYQMALNTDQLGLLEARQLSNRIPADGSPIARAMVARSLITAGHPRLAEGILNTLLTNNGDIAEIHLVMGEFQQIQNDEDAAITEWQIAADTDDAPAWVQERADELMSQGE
jgi:serine/threonine protein kinase/tetratricopeptide (TPR) repeat protein